METAGSCRTQGKAPYLLSVGCVCNMKEAVIAGGQHKSQMRSNLSQEPGIRRHCTNGFPTTGALDQKPQWKLLASLEWHL